MRKTMILLAGALALTTATASAQRVLSMATLAPAGSTWMRVFDSANRELWRRSNNALSIRWYAGGVQGDEGEVIRKMRSGRLDGAAVTAVGLGQIHAPILAFQLPALFTSADGLVRARTALTGELNTAFETAGFTLLGFGGTGNPRLFSTRALRTPNDLRSAHPWQWRDDVIGPALWTEAGATGVPLQVPEVLSALQTNRIDTLIGSPLACVSLQWSNAMRFMSDRADTASLGGLILSRAAFSGLPADQQTLVREVFAQYNVVLARDVSRDDNAAVTRMQTAGVQVVALNDAERAQWTALFGRVRTRLAGTVGDAAWIARVTAAGH